MRAILLGHKPTFNQFSKINWADFPPYEAKTLPPSPFNRKQKIPPIGKIRVTAHGADYLSNHISRLAHWRARRILGQCAGSL